MLLPLSLICNLSQVLNHALCLCQLYYSISQLGFCQLYSTVAILQVHLYKACHLTLHIQTILYLYILLINHNLILSWAPNRSNKNVFLFSSSGNAFACFIQSLQVTKLKIFIYFCYSMEGKIHWISLVSRNFSKTNEVWYGYRSWQK